MLRILIVDDERVILNGIRMMIEEELELSFPADIVTASGAFQALGLFEQFRPDLILTDIRMPGMDGFEMISRMREKNPSVNIAILTSHADFAYAQQAIRFQVTDFLLKPVDQQALRAALEQAYRKKKKDEQDHYGAALLEIRNMMLYDLSPQELTLAPEMAGKLFSGGYFTVIVLALFQLEDSFSESLRAILSQYYEKCWCFPLRERNQLIAVCNHVHFHVGLKNLEQKFSEKTGCSCFSAGISISSVSWKVLHSLYINAVQRAFYAQCFGENSRLVEISLFTCQDCIRIFLENSEEDARRLFEKYLSDIRAAFGDDPTPEMIYRSFFSNIFLYLENNSIPVTEEDAGGCGCLTGDGKELLPAVMKQLRRLKKNLQMNQKQSGNDALMKKLIGYIQTHYREDISLDELADYVGFHPNYICTVFKKNTGSSYLEFLHRERLRTARQMLRETNFTIEQIAEQVGYRSASQLARVFRKYEKISPSEFRMDCENRTEGYVSGKEKTS